MRASPPQAAYAGSGAISLTAHSSDTRSPLEPAICEPRRVGDRGHSSPRTRRATPFPELNDLLTEPSSTTSRNVHAGGTRGPVARPPRKLRLLEEAEVGGARRRAV